jgi:hypothetical protein
MTQDANYVNNIVTELATKRNHTMVVYCKSLHLVHNLVSLLEERLRRISCNMSFVFDAEKQQFRLTHGDSLNILNFYFETSPAAPAVKETSLSKAELEHHLFQSDLSESWNHWVNIIGMSEIKRCTKKMTGKDFETLYPELIQMRQKYLSNQSTPIEDHEPKHE